MGNNQEKKDSPFKSAKHDRRRHLAAIITHKRTPLKLIPVNVAENDIMDVMIVDGERDEAREPEEHGEGVETEDHERVRDGGEEFGGEGEEDDDEEGPDGDEDHEGVLGGDEAIGGD